jgi:hypothetical protein
MTVNDLRAIIGEAATDTLCERLGGTRIYIPIVPTASSRLVLAVGHGPAARLCDAMPGTTLRLPSRSSQASQARREAILYDLRRGQPIHEIANRHGVTDSHVWAIRAAQESVPCP